MKFSNAYGGSAAPVVVKKSTPFVNITSRTNGRFTDVGSATICWWNAVSRPSASAAARTRCTAIARKKPDLKSSSRSDWTLIGCFQSSARATCTASAIGSRSDVRVQAERSAGERDVDLDLLLVDAGSLARPHAGELGRFGARPDLEHAVLAHPARRVVRLHRGVGQVRQLVRPVDDRRRVCEHLFRAAVVPRDDRLLARFQQPDVLGLQLGGAAPLSVGVVPLHGQGAQPALRVRERVADHGDAGIDRHHRANARLGQRRLIGDRYGPRAEPRRVEHDGGQHSGDGHVDREASGAEDLRHRVDAQPSFAADQSVVRPVLRLDAVGNRELLGARRELRERRLLAARVTHDATLDLDLAGGDVPALCRGGREPGSRLGGDEAVARPEPLRRVRRTRDLECAAGVRVCRIHREAARRRWLH